MHSDGTCKEAKLDQLCLLRALTFLSWSRNLYRWTLSHNTSFSNVAEIHELWVTWSPGQMRGRGFRLLPVTQTLLFLDCSSKFSVPSYFGTLHCGWYRLCFDHVEEIGTLNIHYIFTVKNWEIFFAKIFVLAKDYESKHTKIVSGRNGSTNSYM